mmetsp:Transcript_21173/g.58361  ORF Transcript_21173/g.58361 Transcript_21173/m.58361 type:complete len:249 (+) Transcript_21173:589-1335(+)
MTSLKSSHHHGARALQCRSINRWGPVEGLMRLNATTLAAPSPDDGQEEQQHQAHDHLVRGHAARDGPDLLVGPPQRRVHADHVVVDGAHLVRLRLERDVGVRGRLLDLADQLRRPLHRRLGLRLDLARLLDDLVAAPRVGVVLVPLHLPVGADHEVRPIRLLLERLQLLADGGDGLVVLVARLLVLAVRGPPALLEHLPQLHAVVGVDVLGPRHPLLDELDLFIPLLRLLLEFVYCIQRFSHFSTYFC